MYTGWNSRCDMHRARARSSSSPVEAVATLVRAVCLCVLWVLSILQPRLCWGEARASGTSSVRYSAAAGASPALPASPRTAVHNAKSPSAANTPAARPVLLHPSPDGANVWTWSHRGFFIWFKVVFSVVFLFSSD